MGRRELGKLVFLDLVDRSGGSSLLCDDRADARWSTSTSVTWSASGGRPAKSRRGEPSLAVDDWTLLALRPLPDTFHGVTDTEESATASATSIS